MVGINKRYIFFVLVSNLETNSCYCQLKLNVKWEIILFNYFKSICKKSISTQMYKHAYKNLSRFDYTNYYIAKI